MLHVGRKLELTLAILKPDVICHPHNAERIKDLILQNGFLFVRSKKEHLSKSRVKEFYKEHEGRFFHKRLVTYMSSGPISVHTLAREDAIQVWRDLMGPTKVFRTIHEHPTSIRGQFGLTDTRNTTHGSDSPESAKKEIKFFFPEFSISKWYEEDSKSFELGHVVFDPDKWQHVIATSTNR